jgi:undecaprenyldiphospho-muramoylpentapeptide beta-N-acetylglucosaminyltransferase
VVLAGGGTAGHVNPLLSIADEIRRRNPDAAIRVLGTSTGLEAELVPQRGYTLHEIPRVPLPRKPSPEFFSLPSKLSAAVNAAEDAINEIDAQVVVGFGGYVSTPAYLAARKKNVPVVIHEQNARPGLANKLGAGWAKAVGLTFKDTPLKCRNGETAYTGLPLRQPIADLVAARDTDAEGARRQAAADLGLDPSLPTVLVTGGSLGAVSLNLAVSGAAQSLADAGIQVLHLTGKGKAEDVEERAGSVPNYHIREYLADMEKALGSADVVIARSGAGTVCELTALGLPGIYVPLPIGNGEQRLNATPVVNAGGGLLVEDKKMTSQWVTDHIPPLIGDPSGLAVMASAAQAFGIRDGAARVVDLIEGVLA